MANPLQIHDLNTSKARLNFRHVLEETSFHHAAYRLAMHGKVRAHLLPPDIGVRAINVEQIGIPDRDLAKEALRKLQVKVKSNDAAMSFSDMVDFLIGEISTQDKEPSAPST